MTIVVSKSIPSSNFYTGSGVQTITLKGVQEIILNTKKSLIKVQRARTEKKQTNNPSDMGDNMVKDLQRIEDTIKFRAVLEDDSTETAWNKYWKLRAMCSSGGALLQLKIENIIFQAPQAQAFLEEISGTARSFQGKRINENSDLKASRMEVDLTFYIGNSR